MASSDPRRKSNVFPLSPRLASAAWYVIRQLAEVRTKLDEEEARKPPPDVS